MMNMDFALLGAVIALVFINAYTRWRLNKLEEKVHQMFLLSIEATFEEEKRKNEDILEEEMIPIMPLQTIHAKAHMSRINHGKIYYPILDQYESDEQFVKRVSREWWISDEIDHDE